MQSRYMKLRDLFCVIIAIKEEAEKMRKSNAKIGEKAFIFKAATSDRYGRTKDNPYRIIVAIENQSLYQLANVIYRKF